MSITLSPDTVRLDQSDFYRGDIHSVYAAMRREAPVYWHPRGEFWVLTKHEDIRYVSHNTDVFKIANGVALGQRLYARSKPNPLPDGLEEKLGTELPRTAEVGRLLSSQRNASLEAEMLLNLDPPRHAQVRKIFSNAFTPRVIAPLESWIRELTTECLDQVEPGEPFDLVSTLSVPVPLLVIAALLGVPEADRPDFRYWSDAMLAGSEPDATPEVVERSAQAYKDFYAYFDGQLVDRRKNPGEDLLSRMTQAEVDGEKLTHDTQLSLCMQLLLAGNETTRNMISGTVRALSEHPDQLHTLSGDPGLLRTGAVDEFLRWVTPVMNFGRTAAVDTEIRGTTIRAGEFVHMVYTSGNRDEDVWDDPFRFDVTRPPVPMHVTFGHAEHNCLGQNIARLELRVVFEELLRRYDTIEIVGEPVPVRSILFNAIDHMNVRLS